MYVCDHLIAIYMIAVLLPYRAWNYATNTKSQYAVQIRKAETQGARGLQPLKCELRGAF